MRFPYRFFLSAAIFYLCATFTSLSMAMPFSPKDLAQCNENARAIVTQKESIIRYARLSSDVYDHYSQASRKLFQTQAFCAAEPGSKTLQPIEQGSSCLSRAQLYKFSNQGGEFGAEVRLNCLDDTCPRPIEVIFRGSEYIFDFYVDAVQADGNLPDYYRQAAELVQSLAKGYPNRRILVAGHSLGGGMAIYAAQGIPSASVYAYNPAGLHRANVFDLSLSQRVVSFVAYDSLSGKTDPLDAANRKLEPFHIRFNPLYVPMAPSVSNSDVSLNEKSLHSIDRLTRGIIDNFPSSATCSDLLGYTPNMKTMDVATIDTPLATNAPSFDAKDCPKEVTVNDLGRWFPNEQTARQSCSNPQMLPYKNGGFGYWCASRVVPGPYCGAYYENVKDAAENCQNPDFQPVGNSFRYYCYPRKLRTKNYTYFAFEKDARKECKNPDMYMFNVYFCKNKK